MRNRWYNIDTTAKQVAMVWACAAKRRHWLGEKSTEYEVEGSRPRGRPNRTWKEVVQKDCQARNLNKEDAMDRGRWKKLIKIGWWSVVGRSVFLLVPAHPSSPWQRAVKRLLKVRFLYSATYTANQNSALHNLGSGSWLAIASGAVALCGLSTARANGH